MAHTRRSVKARTSSSGNPTTTSITVTAGDTILVLMIKVVGSTNRAGTAPTIGSQTFTQANSTQKAAASPEASAELWYLESPQVGTFTLTIPNTGALSMFYTVEVGQAQAGMTSQFDGANGGNNTSTNPTPGAVVTTKDGDIGWAIVASGATTWAPSGQAGTNIANTDDGADGGGEQYTIQTSAGSITLSWTFGTSDDWGAVVAFFKEIAGKGVPNNYQSVKAGSGMSVSEKIR